MTMDDWGRSSISSSLSSSSVDYRPARESGANSPRVLSPRICCSRQGARQEQQTLGLTAKAANRCPCSGTQPVHGTVAHARAAARQTMKCQRAAHGSRVATRLKPRRATSSIGPMGRSQAKRGGAAPLAMGHCNKWVTLSSRLCFNRFLLAV